MIKPFWHVYMTPIRKKMSVLVFTWALLSILAGSIRAQRVRTECSGMSFEEWVQLVAILLSYCKVWYSYDEVPESLVFFSWRWRLCQLSLLDQGSKMADCIGFTLISTGQELERCDCMLNPDLIQNSDLCFSNMNEPAASSYHSQIQELDSFDLVQCDFQIQLASKSHCMLLCMTFQKWQNCDNAKIYVTHSQCKRKNIYMSHTLQKFVHCQRSKIYKCVSQQCVNFTPGRQQCS